MEIRDSLGAASDTDARAIAVENVRALQNGAFAELIDEKLTADESFRIFTTLTDDILKQLRN